MNKLRKSVALFVTALLLTLCMFSNSVDAKAAGPDVYIELGMNDITCIFYVNEEYYVSSEVSGQIPCGSLSAANCRNDGQSIHANFYCAHPDPAPGETLGVPLSLSTIQWYYGLSNRMAFKYDATTRQINIVEAGTDPSDPGYIPDPVAPSPSDSSNSSNSEHVHEFIEGTITEPSCISDGLLGVYCKTCGYVRESTPISAFEYTLDEYAAPMINKASAGQNITFEFGEWNSFPKDFMEKIAEKSANGVNFVFHYKWNHVKQEISIPAGTAIDLSLDWYGPAKMSELYGQSVEN